MKFDLFLDSRQSTGARVSSCNFQLNQQIVNAVQVRILSFTFANTLYNVTAPGNTLIFDVVTNSATSLLHVRGLRFLHKHRTDGNTCLRSQAASGGTWTIGTNILQGGSMLFSTLVLPPGNYTGNFSSQLFLAHSVLRYTARRYKGPIDSRRLTLCRSVIRLACSSSLLRTARWRMWRRVINCSLLPLSHTPTCPSSILHCVTLPPSEN